MNQPKSTDHVATLAAKGDLIRLGDVVKLRFKAGVFSGGEKVMTRFATLLFENDKGTRFYRLLNAKGEWGHDGRDERYIGSAESIVWEKPVYQSKKYGSLYVLPEGVEV